LSFRPARLDLAARSLTGAFFCALSLAVLFAFTGPRPLIGLAAGMAGIAVGCALLAPRDYVIEDGGLTVRRTLGAVRVDGPLRVEAVEQRQLLGARRLGRALRLPRPVPGGWQELRRGADRTRSRRARARPRGRSAREPRRS
jgi:hypothetical protein